MIHESFVLFRRSRRAWQTRHFRADEFVDGRDLMKCWASSLGPCEGGQSSEHIVSASIFSSRSILVSGAIWNAEIPKAIGLASATANILCRSHNSSLSPVDDAARGAMAALRGFIEVQDSRGKLRAREWPFLYRFRIHGPLFERFLLKTIINMSVTKDPGYVLAGAERHDAPPRRLIEAAYGQRQLTAPAGLYFHADVGDRVVSSREGLEAITLVGSDNSCIAAAFLFRGFPFFLWLTEEFSPRECAGFPLRSLLHRPRQLLGRVQGYPSEEISFDGWDQSLDVAE